MCKSKAIQYNCGHTDEFRLSTCLGTFSYRPGVPADAPTARCQHDPDFCIQSEQDCSYCQRERALYHLEKSARKHAIRRVIPQINSGPRVDAEELEERAAGEVEAREVFEAEKARILAFPARRGNTFPVVDYLGAKYRAELREEAGKMAASPLREEVKPEDVVDEDEEEWSCGRDCRSKCSLGS